MTLTSSLLCIALAIHIEARGEPERGKVAVGYVLLRRAELREIHPCKELSEWSWVNKSTVKRAISHKDWAESRDVAADTLMLYKFDKYAFDKVTHFHNRSVQPSWGKKPEFSIGNHKFYSLQ